MEMSGEGVIRVITGTGEWWGCGLEIQAAGKGENLSKFKSGRLHFDIKGDTESPFRIGFQTGVFTAGTQVNNAVKFGPDEEYQLSETWSSYSIPLSEFNQGADLADVTGIIFLRSDHAREAKDIEIRNVFFSQK